MQNKHNTLSSIKFYRYSATPRPHPEFNKPANAFCRRKRYITLIMFEKNLECYISNQAISLLKK